MARYRVPRIIVGPNTKEIVINVARAFGATDKISSVELLLTRRKCNPEASYKFTSYTVCGDSVHFEIPDAFITADIPNGFYDGEVYIDDCAVTRIEVIKGPSRYATSGKSVDAECKETNWEEPPCEEDDDPCSNDCMKPVKGCAVCCDVETPVVDEEQPTFEIIPIERETRINTGVGTVITTPSEDDDYLAPMEEQ